jgi:phosphoenolpyruvate-protein phosphotransferase (PTS system enzyme I)
MRRLSGIGVSGGVVSGRAVILIERADVLRYQIRRERVGHELERLEASRRRSKDQLTSIRKRMERRRGPELASLFDAQLLMLDDPMLVPLAADLIRQQYVNAEWAIQQVFDDLGSIFDEVADPYLRERKGDVADVVGRIKMNLGRRAGTGHKLLRELDEPIILVADELTLSMAAQIDRTKVRGLATDAGSRTYHTAILARSLEVPAVVGLHNASQQIRPGELVVIDGTAGELIVDPTGEVLARVVRHSDEQRPASEQAEERQPAVTADGVRIRLDANIEFPDDVASARYAGAEGIGLYRSEFLFAGGADEPMGEDEQCEIYRRMLTGMAPGTVTVRTFDLDEGQLAAGGVRVPQGDERRIDRQGLRGLRLSLTRPELFTCQLRALLRAARHGQLRIMFPFVSGVSELRRGRELVEQAAATLRDRGEVVPPVPIGAMLEIPAAVATADLLAREVDFFTIGTNDLIQYCLAVDRADERASRLYDPLHPAVLRMITLVRRTAARRQIPVSLCGEMAADPSVLALLVGLGLTDFSMAPHAIPEAKRLLGAVTRKDLHALGRRVQRLATSDEIHAELAAVLGRLSPARGGVIDEPKRP